MTIERRVVIVVIVVMVVIVVIVVISFASLVVDPKVQLNDY